MNGIMVPSYFESKARWFAEYWHGGIDQRRKYTNEPYINHPATVAEIVRGVPHTTDMLCAAWLHDVVEDTQATISLVNHEFGWSISTLVGQLTDVSEPSDGNRETRKRIDRQSLSMASREAKTIKLADLIDNTSSIVKYDPGFARVYLKEKELLLEVLRDGDQNLWHRAHEILINAKRELGI